MMMSESKQTSDTDLSSEVQRRPYLGSCHCGSTRYVCWLTLPASAPYAKTKEGENPCQMFRKCNCNACHKTGFLHIRLPFAPDDFALLSPLDPVMGLTKYEPNPGSGSNWCFCKTCGVRCFMFEAPGEVVQTDLLAAGVDLQKAKVDGDGKAVDIWRIKPKGFREEQTGYLRVNAYTLEPDQAGLDLREWHEKHWIQYVNWLDEVEGQQYHQPYHGGAY